MTDYHVTLPDGRAVVVDAPDEAGARAAAKNFMMRNPTQQQEKAAPSPTDRRTKQGEAGGVDNFGRSLASGASMGFADEIAAAGDATFGPPVDWALGKLGLGKTNTSTAPTWSERYTENVGGERAQDKGYADSSPVWDTTGRIGGAVGGALATLPRFLLTSGTGLVGGVGRSAATGAGLGGVTGFGEGEGGFNARLENAGKGAALGGIAGGVLHPLVAGAGALGGAIAESSFGRGVADKAIAPGMRFAAEAFDRMAPKVVPKSLSAASPDGTAGLPSGVMADAADAIRGAAPTGEQILDTAASRRIADAIQRGGSDIPGMGIRLGELGQDAMILDANPMTQRLGRTAYIAPGRAPAVISDALDARNRATGTRVGNTIQESFGDTAPAVTAAERMRLERSGQGRTDYAEAVGPDAPYRVSPEMRQIMQEAPAVQRAMDAIEANAAERGVRLTPAQVAHRVKQQLAADTDAAFASGRAINKDDVRTLSDRWRTALHDANPAIREADAAWQARSNALDALDLGRQFMRQGTGEIDDAVSPHVLAERIPRMTAEEARAFLSGAADTLYTKTNSGPNQARQVVKAIDENQNLRSKLVTMLGEQNAQRLFNRAMSERTFAATDRVVRGGSDTASKILSAMDDAASGEIPLSPNSMLSRVMSKAVDAYNKQRAGNEDVRARIAQMLTSTDAEANAEMLDRIARQLSMARRQPKAVQRGAASTAGQEF